MLYLSSFTTISLCNLKHLITETCWASLPPLLSISPPLLSISRLPTFPPRSITVIYIFKTWGVLLAPKPSETELKNRPDKTFHLPWAPRGFLRVCSCVSSGLFLFALPQAVPSTPPPPPHLPPAGHLPCILSSVTVIRWILAFAGLSRVLAKIRLKPFSEGIHYPVYLILNRLF